MTDEPLFSPWATDGLTHDPDECGRATPALFADLAAPSLTWVRAHRHPNGTIHIEETGTMNDDNRPVGPDGTRLDQWSEEAVAAAGGDANLYIRSSLGQNITLDGDTGNATIRWTSPQPQTTVSQPTGFVGVTVWMGNTIGGESGPQSFSDDCTPEVVQNAASTYSPIQRAVMVARLRALAKMLERG